MRARFAGSVCVVVLLPRGGGTGGGGTRERSFREAKTSLPGVGGDCPPARSDSRKRLNGQSPPTAPATRTAARGSSDSVSRLQRERLFVSSATASCCCFGNAERAAPGSPPRTTAGSDNSCSVAPAAGAPKPEELAGATEPGVIGTRQTGSGGASRCGRQLGECRFLLSLQGVPPSLRVFGGFPRLLCVFSVSVSPRLQRERLFGFQRQRLLSVFSVSVWWSSTVVGKRGPGQVGEDLRCSGIPSSSLKDQA